MFREKHQNLERLLVCAIFKKIVFEVTFHLKRHFHAAQSAHTHFVLKFLFAQNEAGEILIRLKESC